jgi:hypothetical protein
VAASSWASSASLDRTALALLPHYATIKYLVMLFL